MFILQSITELCTSRVRKFCFVIDYSIWLECLVLLSRQHSAILSIIFRSVFAWYMMLMHLICKKEAWLESQRRGKNHRLKFDICILTPRNLDTLSSREGKWVERKNNRKQKVLIQLCPMLQTESRLQWGLVISFSRQIQTPVINNHCYGQLKRVHQNFFLRSVSNVMLLPV